VTNGAQLSTDTYGLGDAGNMTLTVGQTARFDGEDPTGTALSGASSSVARGGTGQGGTFNLSARNLNVTNGAQLSTSTFGQGDAGDINIAVAETALFDGKNRTATAPSTAASSVEPVVEGNPGAPGKGQGGALRLSAQQLTLSNGAQLSSQRRRTSNETQRFSKSSNLGRAGDVTVTTDRLTISDPRSGIFSGTLTGNGGDISLNVRDLLLMRRGGNISTTAGTAQAGGNGGNITISAPQGFLLAVLAENSDISANAFTGSGGNVNITAQGIYGLQFQPRLTPSSDITASSTLGVNGVVTLNTPGLDPSKGLVALPTGLVDPSNKIDQRCAPRGSQRASSFVNTGTGGIAAGPTDPLASSDLLAPLVPLPQEQQSAANVQPEVVQSQTAQPGMTASADQIIEAQGWVKDTQGKLWLVADRGLPHSPAATPIGCAQNQTRAPARSGHQTGGLYR
jgi:large exoprotein involved in heme utilization and adhesion